MTRIAKSVLKQSFQTGDTPSEQDFINLIDSSVFTDEEFKTNNEANANTNAYTDADQTKVQAITDTGSGEIITSDERRRFPDNINSATGRAITDADYNKNINVINNNQVYNFNSISNGFMMTFSTPTGTSATLTKTGETTRILDSDSYYLITFFNNVFKISPE